MSNSNSNSKSNPEQTMSMKQDFYNQSSVVADGKVIISIEPHFTHANDDADNYEIIIKNDKDHIILSIGVMADTVEIVRT